MKTLRLVILRTLRGVNIGGLSGIASTELEKIHGFWAAFLLPLCSLAVSLVAFFMSRHRYGKDSSMAYFLKAKLTELGFFFSPS